MVIYFVDRFDKVLATASNKLNNGNVFISDTLTDELETGVKTFEVVLVKNDTLLESAKVGNYLLAYDSLFCIITSTVSTGNNTITLYCEDAGLDLINRICGTVASGSHALSWWISNTLGSGSGWSVQYNGVDKTKTDSAEYASEDNALSRLHDICSRYNLEFNFAYEIEGLKTVKRSLVLQNRRGSQTFNVYQNKEVLDINETKSLEEFATALTVYGKDNKKLTKLSGYSTFSGLTIPPTDKSVFKFSRNFTYKISGSTVICVDIAEEWKSSLDTDGKIEQRVTFERTSAKLAIQDAIKRLEKVAKPVITCDVEFSYLPEDIGVGDTLNILDASDDVLLSSRVLSLTISDTENTKSAELGDFKELSSSFAERAQVAIYGLRIDSSGGVIGAGSINTVLTVTATLNGLEISKEELLEVGALRWYEDGVLLPISDSRISNDGFTFTTGTMTESHNYKVKLEV